MGYKISELAEKLNCSFSGEDIYIESLNSLDDTKEGCIAPLFSKKKLKEALETKAACFVVPEKEDITCDKPLLVVKDGKTALAQLIDVFYPAPQPAGKIAPSACVAESAEIDPSAVIEHNVVIGNGCKVGAKTIIKAGSVLEDGAVVGRETLIYPNVTIYENCVIGDNCIIHSGTVIGSDGYGFYSDSQGHHKMRHVGNVVIGNSVELGANCSIDRGTLSSTVIGDGSKLDNFIHVAHNVQIGKNCLIMAKVIFAGSTTIGDNVIIGGLSALSDHITVPSNTVIFGHTLVYSSIKEPGYYAGEGCIPKMDYNRNLSVLKNLAGLKKQVNELKRRLDDDGTD